MQSFEIMFRSLLMGSAAIGAAVLPVAAFAQEQPAQAATDEAEDTNYGAIVVTANKREQNLNDVGLAITALSGDTLQKQGVSSLADLSRTVPSLTFQPTQYSTPVYTLRGVGFYDSTLASYPTVSVYLDEAPLPLPVMTTHTAFDLERVEVLKGPQGTLFGNNSTGGAINFIASKPTETFEAGGNISFGRFARVEGNAYVSGPLTENLTARVAVNGAMADGWQRSISRPADTNGEVGYIAGRVMLDWRASDGIRFQLNVNGWRDSSDPVAPQYVGVIPQFPGALSPEQLALPFAPRNARAADWQRNKKPNVDEKMGQLVLRGDFDLTTDITLTSVTSYAAYARDNANYEFDGTPYLNGDYFDASGRVKTFSQELRIGNGGRLPFRWVIGANYERTNTREFVVVNFSEASLAPVFGFTGDKIRSRQNMRNYAVFGNAEYDISDQLTVKGGIRYTQADRAFSNCTLDGGDGTFSRVFTELTNAIQLGFLPVPGFTPTGVPIGPIGPDQCNMLDNVTFDGTPVTYLPGELFADLDEDNVSWRVGVDFKPSNDLLLYANVARGYKAGSFPFLSGASFDQNAAVTQESLLSYEAGFKASVFDRRINVNGAAFLYKYDDKQLRGKVPDPIFNLLEALVNVPKSELKGVELEISGNPAPGLTLSVAGSYIDSEIKEYTNYSRSNNLTDFAGSRIPYTPKWQLNSSVDYVLEGGKVQPFVGATYSWRSDQFANIGGSRGLVIPAEGGSDYPLEDVFKIKAYGLLDLRAGVEAEDGSWRVSVFGKNVTNKYYTTNVQTAYDNIVRFAGMPATYGVTLAVKYR